jgi:NAD(P)-dependent dehydrogenase (short-subunit alcohol dehydrogenase family)
MSNVVITGANRGIGLALAHLYAGRGDRVFGCCRTPRKAQELQTLAKSHGLTVLPVDVGDAASVAALAAELGPAPVDVLINNAGVSGGPLDQQTATRMDFAAWADAFNVNSIGPVRVLHALLPALQRARQPKVMSITSQLGAISLDLALAYGYSSSKAALNKYMRLAAPDLARDGVAIGVIHPGWVQTDMGGPARRSRRPKARPASRRSSISSPSTTAAASGSGTATDTIGREDPRRAAANEL